MGYQDTRLQFEEAVDADLFWYRSEGDIALTWKLFDLFSGIGGFSLAAQWVWGDELEIVAFCEIDKFCQKVLRKHWPNVPIIEDVRNVTLIADSKRMGWEKGTREEIQSKEQDAIRQKFRDVCTEGIDLLTGGFPCQPFSVAGKRKGKEDDRFLWPEMFRVIKEIRPRWVVAENVAGIVRMALDDCLSDLEGEGYSTQAVIIPACAVNAPHRRDRVWIVAHTEQSCRRGRLSERLPDSDGRTTPEKSESLQSRNGKTYSSNIEQGSQDVADSKGKGLEGTNRKRDSCPDGRNLQCPSRDRWSTEPSMGELVNGVSGGLVRFRGRVAKGVSNRVNKLKSLGNAIVPQVAEQIFRAIKQVET